MKIKHDIIKRFGDTPGCAKSRKLSRNECSHPSLAHSQECRLRIETASKTGPVHRDRVERAAHRKMDFYAKEVERSDHSRRVSMVSEVVPGPPAVREAKRNRGEQVQDLSEEIRIPIADETLNPPELQTTPSSSTSVPILSGGSSSSGVKRTFCKSTGSPIFAGVSSGSGVKRSHDESFMSDDEEQPVTRARVSALSAGLHGVAMQADLRLAHSLLM